MKKIIMLLTVVTAIALSGMSEARISDARVAGKSDSSATREALEGLRLHQHSGVVSAFDREAGKLVIKNRKGEFNLGVDADTQVKRGREKLAQDELKPGMSVTVRYWEKEGRKIARIVKLSKD